MSTKMFFHGNYQKGLFCKQGEIVCLDDRLFMALNDTETAPPDGQDDVLVDGKLASSRSWIDIGKIAADCYNGVSLEEILAQ